MLETGSPPKADYFECARRLGSLHDMLRNGLGDSDEADRLRDEMDPFWDRLTPEEADRIRALSADLATIGRESAGLESPSVADELRSNLRLAAGNEDWERALSLVRETPGAPPAFAAAVRGGCWALLGDLENAARFLEESIRLAPADQNYKLLLVLVLVGLGRTEEATRHAIASPEEAQKRLGAMLAHLKQSALASRPTQDRPRTLLSALDEAVDRGQLPGLLATSFVYAVN